MLIGLWQNITSGQRMMNDQTFGAIILALSIILLFVVVTCTPVAREH